MTVRVNHLLCNIGLFLAIVFLTVLLSAEKGFSADTYAVPQTTEVTLAWDANDPAPEGYRIFQRIDGEAYDYTDPVWTGTDTSGSVYNLEYDTTYYFVVRAYEGTLESADSEEVSYTTPASTSATYSITATAGEGGTVSPSDTTTVSEGVDQTYTIMADDGYHIADVLVDGVSQGVVTEYTFTSVSEDHTISASFAIDTYSITASAGDGGTISPSGTSTVSRDADQTFTITADSGYHIAAVFVDGVSQGALTTYTFTSVSEDHSISASFAIDTYSITASAGDGGTLSPSGTSTVSRDADQTFTITADSGYHIADVLVDGVSQGAVTTYTFTSVSAAHTISASFAIDTYSITASAGDGGTLSPSGTSTVSRDADQTFTITADSGYHIADVLVDGVSQGAVTTYTFTSVSAAHTISASFAIDTYSITASAGDGGTISPSGTSTVSRDADQTFTITADSGYHIADVLVDGVSQGAVTTYTFTSVSAAHTISASFAIDTYSITASAGDGGTISPSGTSTVSRDADQTFTITADSGYHIADVLVDGVSQGAVTTYTFTSVSAAHTISASFAIDTYSITASAGDGGNISPSGRITVDAGSSQTFTITVDDGYEILDVLVNGSSMGQSSSISLDDIRADYTVVASFALQNQAPVADAGPDQTVDEGQLVTLSGLNSVDLDDGIASFQWNQIQGVDVTLIASDQAEVVTFTTPNVDTSGASLVFELTVTDYNGETSVDTCIVNVTWVNVPPTADAGGAQTVSEGEAVVLDASGSTDPDDGIATYYWTQLAGPTVTLSGNQSASASFNTPDIDAEGATLTFQLTVTDTGGLQDTDSVLITVEWVNQAPLADAGPDQSVDVDDEVTLDGSLSTDIDDTIKAFRWSQTDGTPVELSDATAEKPTFIAPDAGVDGGSLTFELTVTDSGDLQGKDSVTINVAPSVSETVDTTAPTLVIESPSKTKLLSRYSTMSMSGRASDDQGVEQITWVNSLGGSGVAAGTDSWQIDTIPLQSGTNIITVTAVDAAGNSTSATVMVFCLKFLRIR
ncbi:fibronectin type III domain-containing protein [Desulfosarcina ovata]|uniref:Fibronectin type-III domain-containing protein n=1 Tax=Desulfosarcina ovata subsp. ovata TaxID=2752305 RepID=A0A5K8AGU4_9BACT|nr:fibronectin type III domain-containing protein [Desulfosarcina ovata]BBO91074.1 hypothetical protein DSCOOX_42540 [Desulfosarcina ovata subsp. ovata]